jgi:hypothetical protein
MLKDFAYWVVYVIVNSVLLIGTIFFIFGLGKYIIDILKGNVNTNRGSNTNITINKNIFIVPKKDNTNQ